MKRAHRISSRFVETFKCLRHTNTHAHTFTAAAAGISNVRFTYSFSLITSNPFPSLSDLLGSQQQQQQYTHLQELILVFVFSFDFVHASHRFFVLPSLATFLTALYMRCFSVFFVRCPLFPCDLVFLSFQHANTRIHSHTPRFSSHFSDCQILYPILTAINDKRYDAAIKPSRLHITVAIKTMILSTTSIFIVVCVCVHDSYSSGVDRCAGLSSIPLLCRCSCVQVYLNVYYARHTTRDGYGLR